MIPVRDTRTASQVRLAQWPRHPRAAHKHSGRVL